MASVMVLTNPHGAGAGGTILDMSTNTYILALSDEEMLDVVNALNDLRDQFRRLPSLDPELTESLFRVSGMCDTLGEAQCSDR